jgi:uncharacterized Fe-S cluster protein YjdI/CDGSH-type Zn-finger protein
MPKKKEIHYSNGEVTVKWQPGLCIHSEVCIKGLPEVFDMNKKPWINIQGADSETIVRQVGKCPSGALSMLGAEDEKTELIVDTVVVDKKPALVEVEANKNYAWCACGRSKNQPWCDGSHKGTSITPVVFKPGATEKKAMCMCKQSKGQPFCDGSHNHL